MDKRFLGASALALALLGGASAYAQKGGAPAAAAMKLDTKELGAAISGNEPAKIADGLDRTRVAGKDGGGKALVPVIVSRIQRGLPKDLLKKALETLGDLEDPAAAEIAEQYLSHREADVRVAAVNCLGSVKGPVAVRALRNALGDLDARVHALAATHLGTLKAPEAIPDLVIALDKGVNEAASSIGMLCDAKTCDVLLERLATKPFDVISSGIQQVMARAAVGDDVKKKFIAAVQKLQTRKAREFLQELRTAWPKGGSKAVETTLDDAIKSLEGAK
jgi:HEAT repeat protein